MFYANATAYFRKLMIFREYFDFQREPCSVNLISFIATYITCKQIEQKNIIYNLTTNKILLLVLLEHFRCLYLVQAQQNSANQVQGQS